MRAKTSLGISCLVAVGLALAYGLGYEQGRSDATARLSQAPRLRQIGLAFRIGHNDFTRVFTTSGPVTVPSGKKSEH